MSAKIVINEIEPRYKKHGYRLPTEVVAELALYEYNGIITRRDLRKVLDMIYEDGRYATRISN